MALSSTPQNWTLEMPAGSLAEYLFTFSYPSTGRLYDITGLTWEWVADSGTGTQVIAVSTTPNAQGVLTVTTSASTVQLTLYPAATQSLAVGQYSHALWANPGTDSAFTWLNGALVLGSNPQP